MIDWRRVRELHSEIGAEDFGDLAGLFLAEVEEAVAELETVSELVRLEERLHFLKGAALNLGFSQLARLCAEGERRARAGEVGRVSLAPVVQCFHASREEFLANTEGGAASP